MEAEAPAGRLHDAASTALAGGAGGERDCARTSEDAAPPTVPSEPPPAKSDPTTAPTATEHGASPDRKKATDGEEELDAEARAQLLSQLEKELVKRRPDHFIIGVICRSLGGIPDQYRSSVWKELLGVTRSERLYLDQSILRVEEDLANQKVIAADAARTRGHDDLFKQKETTETLVKILTYYCKCRNVRYKQGMNEVLAPFLMLERDPPLPEGVIFQCFYAMIDKFLPHVFADREFKSLQCSFQLYRLLLLYHDPMLCHYLDQHDMTPELYVTPWFMTLFARNLSPALAFVLWDYFLLQEDSFLLHFVAFALVQANRSRIMEADVAMLPQVLSNITFKNKEELQSICADAYSLMETTPRSFKRDLYSVCYGGFTEAMLPLLRQLSGTSCMGVYADELVSNLMGRLAGGTSHRASEDALVASNSSQSSFSTERNASTASVFFIVLDCRPIDQYRECHLSLSYHIDPDIVGSPDALAVLIKGFSRMKGCHFVFVGPSENALPSTPKSGSLSTTITRLARGMSVDKPPADLAEMIAPSSPHTVKGLPVTNNNSDGSPRLYSEDISVTRFVLMFLQKGFEHISRLNGGFDVLRKEILTMDQFAQDQLLVFPDEANANVAASGGLTLLAKKAATDLMDKVRSASEDDPNVPNLRAKTKATVSSLSMKFQNLTAAAKDAVSAKSPPSSQVKRRQSLGRLSLTDEHQLVGEDEWIEVCMKTREVLEKSLSYKEVVFQRGSLGILFHKSRSKKFQAVVDSLVPDSQASESQQIEPGDMLVAVNGQSVADVPFLRVIEMVKDATRPVVLRLRNPKKRNLESFDAISMPPTPPTLVYATPHSLCITWTKVPLPTIKYHLQYARQSEFNFNPWMAVAIKQDGSAELDTLGVTNLNNGTMVGLDPCQAFVFRIRCGDGDRWGPYSLSSSTMTTLDKRTYNENESASGPPTPKSAQQTPNTAPIFLPGECPEFSESGIFIYRVVIGLRARKRPVFDSEKLDRALEKGTVIKCCERLVVPSTNQVFVRLCDDDASLDATDSEDPREGVWAFENTPDGAVVLERLPEDAEDYNEAPLQHQARTFMTSILSAGSRLKVNTQSESDQNAAPVSSAPPQILQVFPASSTSIVVTWDPVNDVGVTKYQIQYAKNRFGALWWNEKHEIGADTLKHTILELQSATPYIFRVRGGNDHGWGPFSEPSDACKTLPAEDPEQIEENSPAATGGENSDSFSEPAPRMSLFSSPSNGGASLRTGSTFLDKAIGVASRLSLTRRRSVSSSSQAPTIVETSSPPSSTTIEDCFDRNKTYVDIKKLRDLAASVATMKIIKAEFVNDLSSDPNSDGGEPNNVEHRKCEIVLTPTVMVCFSEEDPSRPGFARIEQKRSLLALSKITRRKNAANCIVFHFKIPSADDDRHVQGCISDLAPSDESPASPGLEQLCYRVENVEECVTLVRDNYQKSMSN